MALTTSGGETVLFSDMVNKTGQFAPTTQQGTHPAFPSPSFHPPGDPFANQFNLPGLNYQPPQAPNLYAQGGPMNQFVPQGMDPSLFNLLVSGHPNQVGGQMNVMGIPLPEYVPQVAPPVQQAPEAPQAPVNRFGRTQEEQDMWQERRDEKADD
jgi:hypothetical protein